MHVRAARASSVPTRRFARRGDAAHAAALPESDQRPTATCPAALPSAWTICSSGVRVFAARWWTTCPRQDLLRWGALEHPTLPSAEVRRTLGCAPFPKEPAARPTRMLQRQPILPATGGLNGSAASASSRQRHFPEANRRARAGQCREFTSRLTMQLWLVTSLSASWVWLWTSQLPVRVPPPQRQPSKLRSSSAPRPFVPHARPGR